MLKKTLQIIAAVSVAAAGYFGVDWVYNKGIYAGMEMYHKQCYSPGGMVINEDNGTVVMCAPLTDIPREERPNFRNNTGG